MKMQVLEAQQHTAPSKYLTLLTVAVTTSETFEMSFKEQGGFAHVTVRTKALAWPQKFQDLFGE